MDRTSKGPDGVGAGRHWLKWASFACLLFALGCARTRQNLPPLPSIEAWASKPARAKEQPASPEIFAPRAEAVAQEEKALSLSVSNGLVLVSLSYPGAAALVVESSSDLRSWRVEAMTTTGETNLLAPIYSPGKFYRAWDATGSVTLEWDPSPDAWVAGYVVHHGTVSSNYSVRIDVGNVTTCTVSNLVPGVTYYFVATAYTSDGQESLPSNEVAYTVPVWWEEASVEVQEESP